MRPECTFHLSDFVDHLRSTHPWASAADSESDSEDKNKNKKKHLVAAPYPTFSSSQSRHIVGGFTALAQCDGESC